MLNQDKECLYYRVSECTLKPWKLSLRRKLACFKEQEIQKPKTVMTIADSKDPLSLPTKARIYPSLLVTFLVVEGVFLIFF